MSVFWGGFAGCFGTKPKNSHSPFTLLDQFYSLHSGVGHLKHIMQQGLVLQAEGQWTPSVFGSLLVKTTTALTKLQLILSVRVNTLITLSPSISFCLPSVQ